MAREPDLAALVWLASVVAPTDREHLAHALAEMEGSASPGAKAAVAKALAAVGGRPAGPKPAVPLGPPGELKVAHLAHDAEREGGAPAGPS